MEFFKRKTQTVAKSKPVFSPYVNETERAKKLDQAFKGDVVNDKITFPKELGEKHTVDMKITEGLYKSFGLVTGVVDKYIDFIVGPGFYVKSENKVAEDICKQFIQDVSFDTLLRPWIKEAIVKGDGYMELGGGKNETINGLKVRDSKYMYVDRDDKGNVTKYKQYIGDANKVSINRTKITPFEPFQIAHFSFNKIGDNAYGLGLVQPAIKTINNLIGLEKDMHILMKRKANTPVVVQMGNDENQPTQGDIESFGKDLEWMTNKHEWVIPYYVDMKALDFGKIGDKFEVPLNHDLDMLFFTFQVPEVLMGRGSIPEGLAKVQLEAFQRRVLSIQSEVEKVIEEKIFKRLLISQGIDAHVEFEWGQPSDSDKNERITKITSLLSNSMLGMAFRTQLELELAQLLGINQELIKSDEEQRETERQEPQPRVPGSNTEQSLKIEEKHSHQNIQNFNTAPLKEWLDFNYEQYLGFILDAIDKDNFVNLTGSNVDDFTRGKLTTNQVDSLKTVLKDSFKKNKNLNEIADAIENKVGITDLFNENGKLLAAKDSRKYNIARTESTRLAAEGSLKHYEDKGVSKYSWVASIGDRTCPTCEAFNGRIYEIKNGPRPPVHSGCRCTVLPLSE